MSSSETCVIQVTNIAPSALLEQMSTLFGYVGDIKDIVMYPSEDSPIQTTSKCCYIRYAEAWCVGVSQHLTNTVFIDRALIVLPVANNKIPDATTAQSLTSESGLSGGSNSGLISQVVTGVGGAQVITTIDPRLTALGLPQYPPLPANMDPSKIEEIRRTVYVGNLDSTITAEQLLKFFNQIGEVKYVRMAGDETQPTRFAFVEFTEQSSVANALQYNGVIFGGRPLKINHSNNAIVKPQAKSSEAAQKEIEEAMKRVREAQSLISAAIEPGYLKFDKILEAVKDDKKRSKSRSRSRSPRRERERSITRSLRRSRSRGRRSRSRDRRRRRSRSRERRRSPRSPRRRRSRSPPRERRLSSRSRSRERRHRKKSRSRERERVWRRNSRSPIRERLPRRRVSRSRSRSKPRRYEEVNLTLNKSSLRRKERSKEPSPVISPVKRRESSASSDLRAEGPALPPELPEEHSDIEESTHRVPEGPATPPLPPKSLSVSSTTPPSVSPVKSVPSSPSPKRIIASSPPPRQSPIRILKRGTPSPPRSHRIKSRSPLGRRWSRRSPSPAHIGRTRSRKSRSRSRSYGRGDKHRKRREKERSRSRDVYKEKKRKKREKDEIATEKSSRVVRDYDEEEKGFDSNSDEKDIKSPHKHKDKYSFISPRRSPS